jgi:hypothetical protein
VLWGMMRTCQVDVDVAGPLLRCRLYGRVGNTSTGADWPDGFILYDFEQQAWLRLKEIRDVASGLVVLTMMLTADRRHPWPAFTNADGKALYLGDPITVGAAANINSLRFFDAIYTTVRGKPFAAQ